MKRFCLLVGLLILTGSLGCVEDSGDSCPVEEGNSVAGIQGVVVAPSCTSRVSNADVTVLHGSGATVTVTTDPDGNFNLPASILTGDGLYQVTVTKGPFNGTGCPDFPCRVTVTGGNSPLLVIRLNGG